MDATRAFDSSKRLSIIWLDEEFVLDCNAANAAACFKAKLVNCGDTDNELLVVWLVTGDSFDDDVFKDVLPFTTAAIWAAAVAAARWACAKLILDWVRNESFGELVLKKLLGDVLAQKLNGRLLFDRYCVDCGVDESKAAAATAEWFNGTHCEWALIDEFGEKEFDEFEDEQDEVDVGEWWFDVVEDGWRNEVALNNEL